MPTYQYVCTECGTDLEAVQSFSDAALTECPSCGGRLRKRFGAVGVVFKGSGFYRTDSRSGNGAKAGSPAGRSSESSGSSGDSGSSGPKAEPSTPSSPASSSSSSSSSSASSGGSSPASKAAPAA